jgi:hypothetical protein
MLNKKVTYAYPGSDLANAYNNGQGCYFLEIIDTKTWETVQKFGPHSSVEDSEALAEAFTASWWHLYKKYPLNGSKFLYNVQAG